MLNNPSTKRTRYAIYTRYSSEMQSEISLEAQEALCREEIAKRGGQLSRFTVTVPNPVGVWSGMALLKCAAPLNMANLIG
jgi:hypothetical protein